MEENKQSFGKEWQESGLQSERTGFDAGECPDRVVVSEGASCEAARMRTAKSLRDFDVSIQEESRASITGPVLLALQDSEL